MGVSIVTGANRGIGLELCRQLKARGADVIAVCRRSSTELGGLGVRVEADVDVTDGPSVAALAGRLASASIDLLINNAGVFELTALKRLDFGSIQRQIEINAYGPLRMTAALRPALHAGSKVVIVTSRMGSIGDNTPGGEYGYRMSKAAVNAAGVSLARDLRGDGIAVALLHPGMVRTDMTAAMGDTSGCIAAADSVRGLLARIDALSLESTGRFIHAATGEALPW